MGFWDEFAAAEQARRDEWLDVEPDLCATCGEVKRGVLLGICTDCFKAWEAQRGTAL
jgi:hypothetical protein